MCVEMCQNAIDTIGKRRRTDNIIQRIYNNNDTYI